MSKQINIAYYRVSTKKQGQSGLGLEAQKMLVFGLLKKRPDFEFTDIETGSNDERVELEKAMDLCKELGFESRLVIAKLDRLGRDLHFITGLMKAGIDFVCCDNPTATPFTLHILAAVAEHELKMIKERTRNAIAAKEAREHAKGNITFRWGKDNGGGGLNPNRVVKDGAMSFKEILDASSREARKRAISNPNIVAVKGIIESMCKKGKHPLEIATFLNDAGFKAPDGIAGKWSVMSIRRVCGYFGYNINKKERAIPEFFKKGRVAEKDKGFGILKG